jgi:ABC-2 type transport system permease protein
MTLALITAHYVFRVPIRGSLTLLYATAAVFMLGTLGIGIYVSTLSRTIPQAMQMGFLAILPSIYLSGLLFPLEGMPRLAQYLARLLPITYFLRVIRGVVLKGTGLPQLWPDIWPLALFGVVIFGLAVHRFRKSLD